ncbi:MAG: gliding motility-associated C-terminal domain-containing protein [Pedobacter sp.]|uniref:T9SS type B sorting domain-containing protein n=1 Tax=Pedobacter sp. TaxID=1411316 RepID=UPI0028086E5E|nr:gliding motility-associated C-terminal domain-containing protein [Pedobacter sp.]MDQ8003198.1 gliding motility-associated C-terminal domain-containing protein [Pedobacter sp.]
MKKLTLTLLTFIAFFCSKAQDCPVNLGFELKDFTNWQAYIGFTTVLNSKNVINVNPSAPIANRHTIMTSKTEVDVFGKFPVLAPNGSRYSVKLGNSGTGSNAERLTYKIDVPLNKPEFTISYNYAVVFEDPNHVASQQPRFTAKVLDVAKNEYIPCASFEYIATSSLPGFKRSSIASNVLYKDWTTVTLNLSGYQGKEILLEFTTADCTPSGHFGYAYVDVYESCEGLIRGVEICATANNVTLFGPAGFKEYDWFNADKSVKYGSGESFSFNRVLPAGTKVILDLTPYDGFGCKNTITTVIVNKELELVVPPERYYCAGDNVDLTSLDIIENKSPYVNYTFFTDANLTKPLANPEDVRQSGTYYIKGLTLNGCYDIKSIKIFISNIMDNVEMFDKVQVCRGEFMDLTSTKVLKKVPTPYKVSFFRNQELTLPLTDPTRVPIGKYYIVFKLNDCTAIREVVVSNFADPILKIKDPNPICVGATINLTSLVHYAGSDNDFSFEFFNDATMTSKVQNASRVGETGRYYIKVTNKNGCEATGSINVLVENPVLNAINPNEVCYPETVDITDRRLYTTSTDKVTFTYFDVNNRPVVNPSRVDKTGKYRVVITNLYGCKDEKEIQVVVHPIAKLVINHPKRTLEPYIVDITKPEVIAGSRDYERVDYFEDKELTIKMTNPDKIAKSGTYYIVLYNKFGCYVSDAVNVDIGKKPAAILPTAFTPLKDTNNKLYPFTVSLTRVVSFKIYNKWGNLVFQSKSIKPEDGWNGYYKGELQPFETYTWYIEALDELGETYMTSGKTVLIL